jgi:Ribosomal proteins 50S-L15, 50S-L18e, 60S-L27A
MLHPRQIKLIQRTVVHRRTVRTRSCILSQSGNGDKYLGLPSTTARVSSISSSSIHGANVHWPSHVQKMALRTRPLAILLTSSKSLLTHGSLPSIALSQSRGYASVLGSLRDTPGSRNKAIRRGRGPASGKGKTSGRGHKGQGQHGKVPAGFNGGETPSEVVLGLPKGVPNP